MVGEEKIMYRRLDDTELLEIEEEHGHNRIDRGHIGMYKQVRLVAIGGKVEETEITRVL